jgi:hypothetical protein
MNWQEYKKKYLAELLSDISKIQVKISQLSINVDDEEIVDYKIKKELILTRDRIDTFIEKIDKVTTK